MSRNERAFLAAALLTCFLGANTAIAEEVKPENVANKMGGVVDSLGKSVTGVSVQSEQKGIVRDLDEMIAQLEKQCEQCRAGIKKNRPMRGMDDSKISSGQGGIGDLVDPSQVGKGWGKLSERERDRILQSMTEGFPPEYRTVLERYYRRLAEEKSAKATGDGAKSKAAESEKP